jgi:polyhydroxybutyrate depolymerase
VIWPAQAVRFRACLLAAVLGCVSLAPDIARDGSLVAGQTSARHVRVGDGSRDYLLRVPTHPPRDALGRAQSFPLIIVLHGSRGRGEVIRAQSGMDSVAEARRFLVAYPDGTGGRFGLNTDWNAGECCGNAQHDSVDDIGFLRALIADVSTRLPVDTRRVYVAGFSDGARLAYRAACEMAGELAAVASVSGSLAYAHCTPARPIPVIAFHGTADEEVPFADTAFTPPSRIIPAAVQLPPAVQFWMAADGCKDVATHHDAALVVQSTGTRCAADVTFYSIAGAPHGWPVAPPPGSEGTGYVVSASPIIAQFFLRHRLP